MRNKNIVLIGFMATGKTLTSKRLGEILKRKVVSTDAMIEEKEGKAIKEIFKISGEEYFRKVEREVVTQTVLENGIIIDCGGGVVIDPENVKNLKKNGILFHLSSRPEVVLERVKGQTERPLLNLDDPLKKIIDLLAKREKFYAQADYTIDTNEWDVERVCKEIIGKLKQVKS